MFAVADPALSLGEPEPRLRASSSAVASRENSIASMRSARRTTFRSSRDLADVLLGLTEMSFEPCRALGEQAHVVEQLADLGLDHMGGFAHPRIAQDRLHDLDRHHQQRGRDDDDAAPMRLLHDSSKCSARSA